MTLDSIKFPNYAFFYSLAFLAGIVILVFEGRRKKYPLIPWLLLITTSFFFFVIGSKLAVFSSSEWNSVFEMKPLNHPTGATVLGGILLGFTGILLARYFLKLPWSVLDSFALIIPVGMLIQRFGCLLAGCCYGTTTEVPWAIHFGQHAPAFHQHAVKGLLQPDALYSLGVHPVQLYESIGCIVIIMLLIRLRNYFKAPVNYVFFSGMCYYLLRFGLEFFRDIHAYAFDITRVVGLTTMQWVFILLAVSSVITIYYRERKTTGRQLLIIPDFHISYAIFFVILSITFAIASRWLTGVEIAVIYFAFAPIALLIVFRMYSAAVIPSFRVAALILIGCSALFMNQTTSEKKAEPTKSEVSPVVETFNEISGGVLTGSIHQNVKVGISPGCSGDDTFQYGEFSDNYYSGSLGLSRTWVRENGSRTKLGLSGTMGKIREEIVAHTDQYFFEAYNTRKFWSVNPYVRFDGKRSGLGIGFYVGDMYRIKTGFDETNFYQVDQNRTMLENASFYPQVSLRIGNKKKFFVESGLNDLQPYALPATTIRIGMGHGFRSNKGFYLGWGTSSFNLLYLNSHIVIDNTVTLEPYLGFGPALLNKYDRSDEGGGSFQGALNISVRFNQKQKKDN